MTDWVTRQALMNVVLISDIRPIWTDIYTSKIIERFAIGTVEAVGATWTIAAFAIWMTLAAFSFRWKLSLRTEWATSACAFILNQVFCTRWTTVCTSSWARLTCWVTSLAKPCHLIGKCSSRTFLLTWKPNKTCIRFSTRNAVVSRWSNASCTWRVTLYTLLIFAI